MISHPGVHGRGHPGLLRDGPQPRVELAGPGLLRLPLPLHLRPLLHPRVPPVARLQRRGGPRLQVDGAHQGGGVRRHRGDQVLGWWKVVVVVVFVVFVVFVFNVVVPAVPAAVVVLMLLFLLFLLLLFLLLYLL